MIGREAGDACMSPCLDQGHETCVCNRPPQHPDAHECFGQGTHELHSWEDA